MVLVWGVIRIISTAKQMVLAWGVIRVISIGLFLGVIGAIRVVRVIMRVDCDCKSRNSKTGGLWLGVVRIIRIIIRG